MSITTDNQSTTALDALHRLMDAHTRYVPAGFSIDLGHDTEEWDGAIRTVGVREACRHMAEHACAGYEQRSGKPFLFSEDCVAYEIKYHLDAFMQITQDQLAFRAAIMASIEIVVVLISRLSMLLTRSKHQINYTGFVIWELMEGSWTSGQWHIWNLCPKCF